MLFKRIKKIVEKGQGAYFSSGIAQIKQVIHGDTLDG